MNQGLETAFMSLLAEHKGIIYKIAYSYGKTAHDRKDLFPFTTVCIVGLALQSSI
jgi:hypothetical protein